MIFDYWSAGCLGPPLPSLLVEAHGHLGEVALVGGPEVAEGLVGEEQLVASGLPLVQAVQGDGGHPPHEGRRDAIAAVDLHYGILKAFLCGQQKTAKGRTGLFELQHFFTFRNLHCECFKKVNSALDFLYS